MKKSLMVTGALVFGVLLGFVLHPVFQNVLTPGRVQVAVPAATASELADKESIQILEKMSDAFASIAEEVTPAVVTITSEKVIKPSSDIQGGPNPFRDFFGDDLWKRFFEFHYPEGGFTQQALGSGVIVRKDGIILTNNHLVGGAEDIAVTLADGRKLDAEIVGTDPRTDLAVVRVKAKDLPTVKLANSDNIRVGEWVVAIGSPFRLRQTVTAGIVSAKGRSNVGLAEYEDFIQTDAAINPGNSGGALVNLRGELIGINTAIATRTGTFSGIGFAIPINMAKRVMEDLIKNGRVIRGWLGILIQNVDESLAEAMKLDTAEGALVSQVVKDGPAAKAGLKRGDVIVELDGRKVKDTLELRNKIAQTSPGTKVELTVLREGKEKRIEVKLGELPGEKKVQEMTRGIADKLGLEVGPLTDRLAQRLGYEDDKGVLIMRVAPGSAAQKAGLRENDLIMEIDKKEVGSVEEFENAIGDLEPGETMLLLVKRADATFFVPLKLPKE